MECRHCQTANPGDALFCLHCGQPFADAVGERDCPRCGTLLPDEAQFCFRCGHPLTGTQARLEQYVPRELLAKLEAARSSRAMAGERRVVTMLFCDVKGSTAIAETLDPEEWADIMNGVFEYLIAPVYRYEGMLARLMGDAILAFFGAPIAHEDDPERAIRAGLDILEGIQPYREQVKREWGMDFDVRVGINTGLVVVGEVGSDLRVEYTAMGDAINLAARMEQTAKPGTVQISEDTYRLVAPIFDVEPLGSIEAKGKREPVPVYQVLGVKAQRGRLRGITGLDAPLIGRQAEFDVLRRALDAVRGGEGQIVCLSGEAGLGKSRLIDELYDLWEADEAAQAHWSASRSMSYDTARPYGQFQQHIRALCGVTESATSQVARKQIARALESVLTYDSPASRARTARAFEVMLGVEQAQPDDAPPLEGEALKRELFEIMSNTWREWAARAPTVLVFDDLHWADPASLELLAHLFQISEEVPVLFLCAFRPEREGSLHDVADVAEKRFAERYTGLQVRPLSEQQSGQLVGSLLNLSQLPLELATRIQSKAEGNPFYIEEVVRTLMDSGTLVRDGSDGGWRIVGNVDEIAIPDSLQALLVARIDRLPEESRRSLQLASVIGRAFNYRVLARISDTESDLDGHLDTLQNALLIEQTGDLPEREYSFIHALTQDAAYNSILRKHRRGYHQRVGETLEMLFPERVEENAPLLAFHFYIGQDDARALRYYTLAGDAAARLYANAEAAAHYGRALEVAVRGEADGDVLTDLFSNRGRALGLNSRYDDALATYDQMHALALERGDRKMELAALMLLASLRSVINPTYDPDEAQAHLEDALALARELDDSRTQVRILWNLLLLLSYVERPHEAVTYGEQALGLARNLDMREQVAFTLNDIHRAYLATGQLAEAQEALVESRALWRKQDNLPMLSDNLGGSGYVHLLRGEYTRALELASEANQLSRATDSLWGQGYSTTVMGPVYYELGQVDTAIEVLQDSVRAGEQIGAPATEAIPRSILAWVYASLGAVEEGQEVARNVHATIEGEQLPSALESWILGNMARFELLSGDHQQARATLDACHARINLQGPLSLGPLVVPLTEAELAFAQEDYAASLSIVDELLTNMRAWGVRSHLAEALYLKARTLAARGKNAEARAVLEEGLAAARDIGSLRGQWPILFALSENAMQNGEHAETQAFHRQARGTIDAIVANIARSEIRESFLSLPAIKDAPGG